MMLCLISNLNKRTEWLRKKKVFHYLGNNVHITDRRIPLYPNLISIHDNVLISSKVTFATHDASYFLLRSAFKESFETFPEEIGCIEIMDNCYIGANCIIQGNVRIGPNAVVGAGSVVTKDIPPNSVAVGVPAKVIGSFDDFARKRKNAEWYPDSMRPLNQTVNAGLESYMWEHFLTARETDKPFRPDHLEIR